MSGQATSGGAGNGGAVSGHSDLQERYSTPAAAHPLSVAAQSFRPRRVLPVLAFVVAIVAIVGIPRLPPSICFGDAGDIQLAAVTLGITHPPGYAGFVSLGHLFTWVPGLDPAYAVSLFCMTTGIVVLILCVLIQVRVGVDPWAAGSVALLLTAHPRFWLNLTTPEVYMPALTFLAAAAYLVIKFSRGGQKRDIYIAGILFGVALANRPPVLLTLPFIVAAWWLAARRWAQPRSGTYNASSSSASHRRRLLKSFGLIVGCAVLPGLYSLGYLWIRDTPKTFYNYLDKHTAEHHELPLSSAGPSAKLERVIWQATARQFHYRVGSDWNGVRAKLRWLKVQLVAFDAMPFTIITVLGILGVVMVFRRCLISGILLCGMSLQSVFFVCMFRDVGQAADLMPLLFSLAVFGGITLSILFPIDGDARRKLLAQLLMFVVAILTVFNAPHRPRYGASLDATGFLKELDMKTIPQGSVVFAVWHESLPLMYEKYMLESRPDIQVVMALPGNWARMAADFPGRPIFLVNKDGDFQDRLVTPYRNVWRVE